MQLLMTLPNLIRYNLPDLNNIHLTFHWISFKGNLTQFFRAYWNKIKLTWNVSRATSYDLTYLLDILSSWLFIGSHWYAISRSFTGRFGTKNRRWVETRGPFPRNGRFFSQNSPICRISTSVFRHSRFSRCAAARSNCFFCFHFRRRKRVFSFSSTTAKKNVAVVTNWIHNRIDFPHLETTNYVWFPKKMAKKRRGQRTRSRGRRPSAKKKNNFN